MENKPFIKFKGKEGGKKSQMVFGATEPFLLQSQKEEVRYLCKWEL